MFLIMALCYSGCTIFLLEFDKKLRNYYPGFFTLIINKIKKKSVVIAYVPHND